MYHSVSCAATDIRSGDRLSRLVGIAALPIRRDGSEVPTLVGQRGPHGLFALHNGRLPTAEINDLSYEPKALVS
jgi:hypothetical protein